ncbi:hypothetical protein BsWGS_17535 [Bradybaena similaris]
MARLDVYSSNKVLEFVQLLLAVHTFHFYTTYVAAVESHNQAFIQTDKHLTYIVGDSFINSGVQLEIKPGSSFPDIGSQDDNFYSNNIRLDPPMLDFQNQPVGMPRMEKVTVENNDPKHSLHLLSISGSTVHFHCSFFQDKIVPPGGNTSFDVVFLARQVGNVENTLFIHTSIGSIRYQVFGVGIPNPYRLRPYLGARVPINSSFTPIIQIHNPYSTRLQVLEMFASEGDLHLELPSGERESTRDIWEINPFETKAVMKANFVGRVESNHSAFIRIKTNKEEEHANIPELLILPVEVEVSSDPGIYSPVELLDFGILRTLDEPKTIRLNLINTGPKAIHITSVNVSPPNAAVSVDFRPFKIQPDGSRPTTVAHITFRAVKALQYKQFSGRIVVKTKYNNQKLVIPYQANVLHGSLVYSVNTTQFFGAKALWNVTRPLIFTNTFNFSVVIYNVSLPPEVAPFFTILNFTKPVVIQPQQCVAAFLLKFHPNQTQIHFSTMLALSTNASTFSIPITVYNGLMKVIHHRPEKFEGQLDFGTLGVGESRSMIFTIRNDNPVDIIVARFETNMSWASVEILGIEKGNGTTLTCKHNQSEINIDPLYIKPYHYAVFNVSIIAPQEEGAYVADIWMFTQFQDLFIPIIFRAAKGSLHAIPDKFIFDKVYPGRVPYKVVQIHSTFDDYMEVTKVAFQPEDVRFYFIPQNSNTVLLQPHEHTIVGKIYFDSKKECKDDCYVGLPTSSPAGHQWLLGLTLDRDVADTDQYLFTKLQQKWNRLENLQQNMANVTIVLDTNQVWGFLFSAQAHLQWPALVRKSRIKYPLTQIGNLSVSDFIIENLGDETVLFQVLPLSLYPNPHTILDLLGHGLSQDLTDYVDSDDTNTFVLFDLEPISKSGGASAANLSQHRKNVESTLGVIPHKQTIAAFLQPGSKIKVKVGFQPKDDLARSSLIVIRNNLTIIDAVVVQGQGRKGEMRFNNKKPGSHSALTFEMTEKHLKNCDIEAKKQNRNMMPNFTVRRPFTLRNSGELPFYIHGFSINELPCEGYGFKVLDCSGFELPPNSSRKINIAFTPDFTMSQIQRMLTIHTSLGPPATDANYSLQAMVPYDLLSQCSAALPRPNWEPYLYYVIVFLMAIIITCIMGLAYVESDRVMADYIRKKLRATNGTLTFDKGKIFDLKYVGALVSNSVQNNNNTSTSSAPPGKNTAANITSQLPNGRTLLNGHVDLEKDKGSLNHLHSHASSILHTSAAVSAKVNTPNGSRNLRHTYLGTLFKVVKSFSLIKYFNSPKKVSPTQLEKPATKDSGTSPPSPVQKPTATVAALRQEPAVTTTNSNLHHENNILSEKSIPASNSYSSRGRKGKLNGRRQIVVDASGDTTSEQTLKKLRENKDQSALDLNHTKRSTTAQIDDFDDTPVIKYNSANEQLDELDDIDVKFDMLTSKIGKHRAGKHGKSRNKNDINKDRILLCQDGTLADDGDDVSSTTTESSGGDVDDKNSLNQENTSDITTSIESNKRWRKGSNKHMERMVVATHGGDPIEDDSNFELTSKSKAHRKIRVNKELFGGDIMIPSTIELPYCLPKEKEKIDNDAIKRAKKAKKSQRVKGDLSELSLQTESFAQKHSRPVLPNVDTVSGHVRFSNSTSTGGSGNLNFLPDCVNSNQRSGSYSSIVSSGPGVHVGEPLSLPSSGLTPRAHGGVIGSNPLDSVRFGSAGFGHFTENGLPGIVTGGLPSSWNTSVHPVGVDSSSNYGLHPMADYNSHGMFGLTSTPGVETFGYSNNDVNHLYPMYTGIAPDNLNQPQLTMMQQLQVERRRRLWEHQQKVSKGEDWPGFSSPLIRNDSLWDNDYHTVEHNTWSTNTDNTPAGNGFWSTLTNSASNGWSSLQSLANIWASNPQPDAGPGGFAHLTRSQQQLNNITPTFNPFTSMSDIWRPTPTAADLGTSGSSANSSMSPGQWSQLSPPGPGNAPKGEQH